MNLRTPSMKAVFPVFSSGEGPNATSLAFWVKFSAANRPVFRANTRHYQHMALSHNLFPDLRRRTGGQVDVVGLQNATQVGLVRGPAPKALQGGLFVPECLEEGVGKLHRVEGALGKGSDGFFDLDRVYSVGALSEAFSHGKVRCLVRPGRGVLRALNEAERAYPPRSWQCHLARSPAWPQPVRLHLR